MPGRIRRQRHACQSAVRILEPALLMLLHSGPAHGYTLLEQLEKFDLGGLDPSVVYRALRGMEHKGWVTSVWSQEQTHGPPRRVYQLTTLGDERLNCCTQDLQNALTVINNLLNAYEQQHTISVWPKIEGKCH